MNWDMRWWLRGSGIPAKSIILLPIGGITMLDEAQAMPDPLNAWKHDVRIAVAGPLVNLHGRRNFGADSVDC